MGRRKSLLCVSEEPGTGDYLCHALLAMGPWASSPIAMNFNFFACKMGIIVSQMLVNGHD